jgi:signal transduction histidine kinase
MLSKLRLRLSLLYLLGSLAAIALLGGVFYSMIRQNLEASANLAIGHKLARALLEMGEPLPTDLSQRDRDWYLARGEPPAAQTPHPLSLEAGEHDNNPLSMLNEADNYDAELSPIFLVAMDSAGGTAVIGGSLPTGASGINTGLTAADLNGFDERAMVDPDGDRIQWQAARVSGRIGVVAVLAGRSMADIDRLLRSLMIRFLEVGLAVVTVLGVACWWLAGRSIRSTQLAWEKQQEFVANASHELRAPLTLLRASAEMAQRKTAVDDDRHALLGDVLSETDHMNRMVADLLMLSRLDAGRLPVARQRVDADAILHEIAREAELVARKKAITLVVKTAGGEVLGDRARMRQVILILLDNALRHTPSGGEIRLLTRVDRMVHILVEDSGSGIPAKDLPHVMERFYRAAGTREGGSGLGLSIAHTLMETMHGRLVISNRPEGGVSAEMVLPAAR